MSYKGSTFIIELPLKSVTFLAQMTHLYLQQFPDSTCANDVLDELIQQTSCVNRSPESHRVFSSGIAAPSNAVEVSGWVMPVS